MQQITLKGTLKNQRQQMCEFTATWQHSMVCVLLLLLYLRWGIRDVGGHLWSIRVCLRLGVGPLQHVGHAHSTGVFLCHGRLRETQTAKSNNIKQLVHGKIPEDPGRATHCSRAAHFSEQSIRTLLTWRNKRWNTMIYWVVSAWWRHANDAAAARGFKETLTQLIKIR